MKICLFVNGEINDYEYIMACLGRGSGLADDRPMVICCDGGLRHADALGIIPDCCIGDFDSAAQPLIDVYKEKGVAFIVHPPVKDQTDLELAMQYVLAQLDKQGENTAHELLIFGGLGGRFDHVLTNVYMLCRAMAKNVDAKLVDEQATISLLHDASNGIRLYGNKGGLVSLIPLTPEVRGIVTEGLAYPLLRETLYLGYGRGMSNVFANNEATVRIDEGILMVVQNRSS